MTTTTHALPRLMRCFGAPLMLVLFAACVGNIGGNNDGAQDGLDTPATDPTVGSLGQAQIRLLNAEEYRRTVQDLLGIEATSTLSHSDSGSGYDTGNQGKIDENLFAALLDEAERLGEVYVETKIGADFACFAPPMPESACMATIIEDIGMRAWRRPLTDDERAELLALFDTIAADSGDGILASKSLIARLLSSVHFLHRSELGDREGELSVLDPYERASLLSYVLIGTMPDDALFEAAANGELSDEGIRVQVQRLLATDAGKERLVHFVRQWLRVDPLAEMAKNPADFPKLTSPEQGQALYDEFGAYVEDAIFSGGGDLDALLKGEQTFVNKYTADLYGATSTSEELEPQMFDERRLGIMSLASTMSVHASVAEVTKDRPVIRGLLIKNQFLCEEVGLPEGIDIAAASGEVEIEDFDALTSREQFEAIMNQADNCVSCHSQFMPLGFLFGNFDALGQFQTMKGDREIETNVDDISVQGEPMSFVDHIDLIDTLAASPIVSRCFTENMVAYVTGAADRAASREITAQLAETYIEDGGDIQRLLATLLSSPALYTRRWEATATTEEN